MKTYSDTFRDVKLLLFTSIFLHSFWQNSSLQSILYSKITLENLEHYKREKSSYTSLCFNSLQLPSGIPWRNNKTIENLKGQSYTFKTAILSIKLSLLVLPHPKIKVVLHAKKLLKWSKCMNILVCGQKWQS